MKMILAKFAPWIVAPDEETPAQGQAVRGTSLLQPASRVATLLAVFMVLNAFLERVFRLSEQAYESNWLLWECARHRPTLLIPALVLGALAIALFPQARQGWCQFAGGNSLRWFIGGVSLLLAWVGAGQAYNAWFGQAWFADRALLVVLAILVFWRPLFVVPCVALFWAVIWQLNYPSLGFHILLADFKPIANVLVLFSAAFLVNAVFGGRHMHGFLFLTLCLVAANLWMPAYEKLRIGWITHGHVYFLLPNAYTHGWLSFLEPDTISATARFLAIFDWPMRIITLVIELAALVFFLNARTAKWLLILFTFLLSAFFMNLGFLFWKWMLLHAALWVLLFRKGGEQQSAWRAAIFTRQHLALSLVVIAGCGFWFIPARLAWFDTPLTNTIRYEAIGESGTSYDLPARFFAPYDTHLRMASFAPNLTTAPLLAYSYGVTGNRVVADKLLTAQTAGDVVRIEDRYPSADQLDPEFNRHFDEFVRRAAADSNQRLAENHSQLPPTLLRPPPFLWTTPRGTPYEPDDPIRSIRIHRVSSFFDGRKHTLFRQELLRTIQIDP